MKRIVQVFQLALVFLSVFSLASEKISVDPSLIEEKFQYSLENFALQRGFPGAIVTIYQEHDLLLNKAFGNCNVDQVYPICSLSKRFTRMAIEKLIREGYFSRQDTIYDLLNLNTPLKDDRIRQITIQHLLDHQEGWNIKNPSDPLFNLNIPYQTQEALIESILCDLELEDSPGEKTSYSNLGYLLLGSLIEKVTQMSLIDFLNTTFASLDKPKFYQASSPTYSKRNSPFLGSYSLELSTGSFGLAAKASDVAELTAFLERDGTSKNLNQTKTACWYLEGSLIGMTTLLRHRLNNIVIVVFIPDRDDNCWLEDSGDLRKEIDRVSSSLGF